MNSNKNFVLKNNQLVQLKHYSTVKSRPFDVQSTFSAIYIFRISKFYLNYQLIILLPHDEISYFWIKRYRQFLIPECNNIQFIIASNIVSCNVNSKSKIRFNIIESVKFFNGIGSSIIKLQIFILKMTK